MSVMYEDVLEVIESWMYEAQLDRAIDYCEEILRRLPQTPFHRVLGRSWLAHVDDAVGWLVALWNAAQREIHARGLLCQLILSECGRWSVEGFGYSEIGDLGTFCWTDVQFVFSLERDTCFELPGMEDLKAAYRKEHDEGYEEDVRDAHDLTLLLVILRAQELFRAATQVARDSRAIPRDIVVFVAVDFYQGVCVLR